jgi:hypothetical protein
MRSKSFFLWAAVVAGVLVLASCSLRVRPRGHRHKHGWGPPPHAPAHGHRCKNYDGVELVYDSGCGVYVVVGTDSHYYCDGYYYRFRNARWELSVSMCSGWKPAADKSLPAGLRGKKEPKHIAKGHPGRGHGPPPHAPAHGYRHKNRDGVDLVYDSGCSLYVVSGLNDHYYCDGRYYRLRDAGWQVSVSIDSGWKPAAEKSLPSGLKAKKKAKHASKGPAWSRSR